MQQSTGISHYVDRDLESIIVEALRLYAAFKHCPPTEQSRRARDYADALENDTFLLETTTPPDDAAEWPHLAERRGE